MVEKPRAIKVKKEPMRRNRVFTTFERQLLLYVRFGSVHPPFDEAVNSYSKCASILRTNKI